MRSRRRRPAGGRTTPSLIFDRRFLLPGVVRIEKLDGRGGLGSLLAEVLRVHDTLVVDHEAHHARRAVLGGVSKEREAAEHLVADHITVGTALRVWSLALEHLVDVAVERLALDGIALEVARGLGRRKGFADRTLRLAVRRRPV